MDFAREEIIFYAYFFATGCAGQLFRQLRDSEQLSWRRTIGSILAGGLFAFGGVGLWAGHRPDSGYGVIYFLALSAFVGFFSDELEAIFKVIMRKTIYSILKRLGVEVDAEDDDEEGGEDEIPHG